MYELSVEVDFAAAHHLVGYPGDCARVHGHNWVIVVIARAKSLDSIGMAYDFRKLKNAAKELIAPWDHQDLNQLPDFKNMNSSAEQIAKLSFDRLSDRLNSETLRVHKVTVWENARCSASFIDPESFK